MIEVSTPLAAVFIIAGCYITYHNVVGARRIMRRQRPTQSNRQSWIWMMLFLSIAAMVLWGGQ